MVEAPPTGVATGTTTRKPTTCGMSRRSCTQEKPNRLVFWNISVTSDIPKVDWNRLYLYVIICVCFLFGDHSTILTSCLMPRRKARWLSLAAWASGSLQRWFWEFINKKRGFFSSQNHSVLSWTVIAWHPTASWIQARFRRIQFGERGQPVLFVCEELPQRGEHGQVRDPLQGFEAHTTGHVLSKMLTTERSSQGSVAPRFHLVARSGVKNGIERRLSVKSNASTLSWVHEFITYPNNLAACDTLPVACFCSFSARVYHVTRFCSADIKNMWNHLKILKELPCSRVKCIAWE